MRVKSDPYWKNLGFSSKSSRLNCFDSIQNNSCYLPIGSTFDPVYIMMKKKTPVRYSRGKIGLS